MITLSRGARHPPNGTQLLTGHRSEDAGQVSNAYQLMRSAAGSRLYFPEAFTCPTYPYCHSPMHPGTQATLKSSVMDSLCMMVPLIDRAVPPHHSMSWPRTRFSWLNVFSTLLSFFPPKSQDSRELRFTSMA